MFLFQKYLFLVVNNAIQFLNTESFEYINEVVHVFDNRLIIKTTDYLMKVFHSAVITIIVLYKLTHFVR